MHPLFVSFIKDYQDIKELLLQQSQLSFQTTVDSHFRKTFLISCASFHEHYIQKIVSSFLERTATDDRTIFFAISKGIKRQYHTYFTWDIEGKIPNNINGFLGLFGQTFKDTVSRQIADSDVIKSNMKAFLEMGNLRNCMAHENLLAYNLDKSFDELVHLNEQAIEFITFLENKFAS